MPAKYLIIQQAFATHYYLQKSESLTLKTLFNQLAF